VKPIVVATDFSGDARQAALRAALLAREHGAKALLVHVAPELPLAAELALRASGAIERAISALALELERESGVRFAARLARGAVAEALCAAAAGASLLAVGARGQHPLRDFALGTTAERLVRMSPAPVLVVKRPPESPYRRVLAPVDFSADSARALALAARLAPEAAFHVLHAFEAPFESALALADASPAEIERNRREARDAAREAMERMLRLAGLGARATRLLEHGYAPGRIAEAEERIGADLLAIGKHGRGVLEELLIGSVTLHALAAARCDVLVVPSPRAGRAGRAGARAASRPRARPSARRPRRR
jgi:nucleotide-binding universal stress UspA family protein